MDRTTRERRLRAFETGYGRTAGWYVELDGRRLAQLVNCRREEMFWCSYQILPMTDSPAERILLFQSNEFWHTRPLRYRNCELGDLIDYALAGSLVPGNRITMRALYLRIDPPSSWERFRLLCRRIRRVARHARAGGTSDRR